MFFFVQTMASAGLGAGASLCSMAYGRAPGDRDSHFPDCGYPHFSARHFVRRKLREQRANQEGGCLEPQSRIPREIDVQRPLRWARRGLARCIAGDGLRRALARTVILS